MKLKDYLIKENISTMHMAKMLGCKYQTFLNYVNGDRNPPLEVSQLIHDFTKGEVTFQDLNVLKIKVCTCPTCGNRYSEKVKK